MKTFINFLNKRTLLIGVMLSVGYAHAGNPKCDEIYERFREGRLLSKEQTAEVQVLAESMSGYLEEIASWMDRTEGRLTQSGSGYSVRTSANRFREAGKSLRQQLDHSRFLMADAAHTLLNCFKGTSKMPDTLEGSSK
jgi:hypothetical protein